MTTNKFAYAVLLMSVLIFTTSCQSLVDDLNDDPNNFTTITLDLALNQAQLNQASLAGGFPSHLATMWSDQFTGTDRQYVSFDDYAINAGSFDDTWEDIYQRGIVQAQLAQQIAAEQGLAPRQGVGLIMEAYYFGEAASMFGDIPFSQVNKIDEFTDPSYEGQGDVLRAAVAKLDEAIALVGSTPVSDFSGQIYSSTATWAQIANGFKARYLLGLMDYPAALIAAQAAGMTNPDQDLEIISTTTNFGENLYWQFEVEQRNSYLTVDNATRGISHFRNLLGDTTALSRGAADAKTDDAARYAYFIEVGDDFATDNIRFNVTNGWAAQTANLSILTSNEVQLILAESAARTSAPAVSVAALNAARNYWDTKLGGDSYMDYVEADFANADAMILAAVTEKYLGVIGLPAFYDLNRTGNLVGATSEGGLAIAQRLLYPSTEESSNSNFPGISSLVTPLPLYQ